MLMEHRQATYRQCAHAMLDAMDKTQLSDSPPVEHGIHASSTRIQHQQSLHRLTVLIDCERNLNMRQVGYHAHRLPSVVLGVEVLRWRVYS